MCTRLFLAGFVALLLGIQFRLVDTFVLNERVSKILNERGQVTSGIIQIEGGGYSGASLSDFDNSSWDADHSKTTTPRRITPPRWLGWKLISVGAVLILICPRFR